MKFKFDEKNNMTKYMPQPPPKKDENPEKLKKVEGNFEPTMVIKDNQSTDSKNQVNQA